MLYKAGSKGYFVDLGSEKPLSDGGVCFQTTAKLLNVETWGGDKHFPKVVRALSLAAATKSGVGISRVMALYESLGMSILVVLHRSGCRKWAHRARILAGAWPLSWCR